MISTFLKDSGLVIIKDDATEKQTSELVQMSNRKTVIKMPSPTYYRKIKCNAHHG